MFYSLLAIVLSINAYAFDYSSCNEELFGESDPKYLSKYWAQELIGEGLFMKGSLDKLLTEEENKIPVLFSSDETVLKSFYEKFKSNFVNTPAFTEDQEFKTIPTEKIISFKYGHSHGSAGVAFLGIDGNTATVGPTKFSKVIFNSAGYISYNSAYGKIVFLSAGNSYSNPMCKQNVYFRKNDDPGNIIATSVGPSGAGSFFATSMNPAESYAVAIPSDMLLTTYDDTLFGGTSGSAPIAAGITGWMYKIIPNESPEVYALLIASSAIDLDPKGYDCRTGWGLITAPRLIATSKLYKDKKISITQDISANKQNIQNLLSSSKVNIQQTKISSCTDYKSYIRDLFLNFSLDPYDQNIRAEISGFYERHNLSVNALFYSNNPEKVSALYKKIIYDETAWIDLRVHSLMTLALSSVTDNSKEDAENRINNNELLKLTHDKNDSMAFFAMAVLHLRLRNDKKVAQWTEDDLKELLRFENLYSDIYKKLITDPSYKPVMIFIDSGPDVFEHKIKNKLRELVLENKLKTPITGSKPPILLIEGVDCTPYGFDFNSDSFARGAVHIGIQKDKDKNKIDVQKNKEDEKLCTLYKEWKDLYIKGK